ncbi:hypothetical protein NFHSH190041_17160 [Shewanella sp. NFH-SH190041]|nr:hypothetical protein NFHSH190041_17160 [Shewanella sp. NFH-SH190041]
MVAWNKGKRVGQKKAFKLEDIWRIRIRLELEERLFELALFNLAIDSKLSAQSKGARRQSQRLCDVESHC